MNHVLYKIYFIIRIAFAFGGVFLFLNKSNAQSSQEYWLRSKIDQSLNGPVFTSRGSRSTIPHGYVQRVETHARPIGVWFSVQSHCNYLQIGNTSSSPQYIIQISRSGDSRDLVGLYAQEALKCSSLPNLTLFQARVLNGPDLDRMIDSIDFSRVPFWPDFKRRHLHANRVIVIHR